jgi:hypothetical protein
MGRVGESHRNGFYTPARRMGCFIPNSFVIGVEMADIAYVGCTVEREVE